MINIDEYNHIYKKELFYIKDFVLIITLLLIVVAIILNNINYEKYYINSGVITSDKMLKILVEEDKLDEVVTNRRLKIKNKEFAYTIDSISDTLYGTTYYYEVFLNVDISDDLNIVNNVLKFKILLSKKTILEYIFFKIGGFNGTN